MTSYREACAAVAAALGLPAGRVTHVGSALRVAGVLPRGRRGPVPTLLTTEQIGALLIAAASGALLADVASLTQTLLTLEISGVDFSRAGRPTPTLGQVVAGIIEGAGGTVNPSITVDPLTRTALVEGVGDVPLFFGIAAQTASLTRVFTIEPGALRALQNQLGSRSNGTTQTAQ